jgi:7,8-dihydropterin-6-yl-methyl-4-(beta-D-ribofuranosyl)aminobenzene 5'-phosphate synthase
VLVDFGYTPEVLLNNMSILKIDPATFDALVLSHGHYDHFGGLVGFLTGNRDRLKQKIPFFVGGEDAFCIRRTATGGQFGALDRKAILDAGLIISAGKFHGVPIPWSRTFTRARSDAKARCEYW